MTSSKSLRLMGAALAVLAGSSLAIARAQVDGAVVQSAAVVGETVDDPTAPAARLVSLINAEIAALPSTASAEDIEASVVFVLSQGQYPASVVMIALQSLAVTTDGSPNLRGAVAHVQTALLSRKLNRGTAAITGGGFSFVGSGFSVPVTAAGGGTTTYAS